MLAEVFVRNAEGGGVAQQQPGMKWNYDLMRLCVCLCLLNFAPLAQGTYLEARYSFPGAPTHPYAGLVRGIDGNFYGTTMSGGDYGGEVGGYGTVFRMTTNGTITTVASFGGYG